MIPRTPKRFRIPVYKYAGEFVIIFCSITFTWWFDEWRQEKNDRREEKVLLLNMDANLKTDSLNLVTELGFILKSSYTFNDFLTRLQSGDLRSTDSSGFLIRRLIVAPEFHPNKATFEAVKSTGELKLILDDSLVQSVMNLYEVTYPELHFLINIYNMTSVETMWNYSIENHDLTRVLGSPDKRIYKLEFRSENEKQLLINKIQFSLMAVNYSVFRIEKSLQQILQVRSMIRRRLVNLN